MTTKKKSRPLFEVPAEVDAGAQSGWVYRSGAGAESRSRAAVSSGAEDSSISARSMATLSLALAAFTQALALGMTIAALPWTMSLRTMRSITKPDKKR
jgi:hypothetical protein